MRREPTFVELETYIRVNPFLLEADDLKALQTHLAEFSTKPEGFETYNFGMMADIEFRINWHFWDDSENGEKLEMWSYDQREDKKVFQEPLYLYPDDDEVYDFVHWCEEMENCYDSDTILLDKQVSCNMSNPLWQKVVDAHEDAWDDRDSLELEIEDYFERQEIFYQSDNYYGDPVNFDDAIAKTLDIFERVNCEPKPFDEGLYSFLTEGEEN